MEMTTRRGVIKTLLGTPLVGLLPGGPVAAQATGYPSSSVTMVIPWAPGGATDVVGRAVAQRLSQKWGRPVVIDNRAGSSGMIGARLVGRAKPDGLTLLFSLSSLVQAPHLYPSQKFEAVLDELAPISPVSFNYLVCVVRSDFPAKTVPELVSVLRADPGKYTAFGSYGTGTTGHLMGLVFTKAAKLDMEHIGYKGEPPAIVDLLGGRIPMVFSSGNAAKPLLDSGKARVVASTGAERSLLAPDVPTFGELGYGGMELGGWMGMFAPRGTPADIVAKISKDVNEIVADPALQKQFREFDFRLRGSTPEAFSVEMRRQYQLWGKMIRDAGVTAE
jgi:tripartite-type tricarboxylate transporter receptor subunit TctC